MLQEEYDLNGDGVLDEGEMIKMMVSLGFAAEKEYLHETFKVFGTFDDHHGKHGIAVHEFESLWEHLNQGLDQEH